MDMEALRRQLPRPGAEFRSLPFYALNAHLQVDEVRRQAEDMLAHGMGGYFLHSREGLETEYMGEDWMEAIRAAVEAAKARGGQAWLYDEDRFPSGGAGGKVQSANRAAFGARAVTVEILREGGNHPDALALFALKWQKGSLVFAREIGQNEALRSEEQLAVFREELSAPCEWFNNEAPPDNLNPAAVRQFILSTHEEYRKRFEKDFGETIRGIFTDEPNIADFRARYSPGRLWIPWTEGFAAYFAEKRGYAATSALPWIFFTGEGSFQARHDYWRTITERFCEAYSRQIGQWCEKHHLQYTGHYMGENALSSSTRMSGAVMPHYVFEHMPGIDMLTGDARELLTARQCSSVANQLGRRSICEMYGCSGWEFTFEGQKRAGDWLYAMGIDTRCQHHALYTIRGCAKRDYPPTFNYNSIWWEHNSVVEDYFARLSAALSGGRAVRPVLVLHPQSSAWGVTGAGYCQDFVWHTDDSQADALQAQMEALLQGLFNAHVDFDFGDELILEWMGEVESGAVRIGQMRYPIVVLPYLENMEDHTFALLAQFLQKGGRVLTIGNALTRIQGIADKRLQSLEVADGYASFQSLEALLEAVQALVPERVRILEAARSCECAEIACLTKEYCDHRAIFAVNTDALRDCDVRILLPQSWVGNLYAVNLLTGDMEDCAIEPWDKNFVCLAKRFMAGESALYLLENEGVHASVPRKSVEQEQILFLPPRARVTRTHPNALLLDTCRWRLGDGPWREEEQIWSMQNHVRASLGMRRIYANGSPQRYRWVFAPHPGDGARLQMEFAFEVADVPETAVQLAAEGIEGFSLFLNGETVALKPDGWFMDRCVKTYPLPRLQKGRNVLLLVGQYRNACQLEDCFLIGDFGVNTNRAVDKEPEFVRMGDWCLQGYFHYAGGLRYHYALKGKPSDGARLFLGRYEGVTASVYVNGRSAGSIPWHSADGLDISAFLEKGENHIDIEIMGSQRNLLGLFHQTGGQNVWVDWTFFQRADSRIDPEYVLRPYGLMERPRIAWKGVWTRVE